MSLHVTHTRFDDMECLKLKGEFTADSIVEFNNILETIFMSGEQTVVLDMEHVHFIDSPAVGLVAHLLDNASAHNHRIAFYKINPYVKKVMTVAISADAIHEVEIG